MLLGKRRLNSSTPAKLCGAVSRLERAGKEEAEQTKNVLDEAGRHCELEGLRHFAKRAGVDPANLNRALKGRTNPGPSMLAKLRALLAAES